MRNLEIVDRYLGMTIGLAGKAHDNFWYTWENQKNEKLYDLFDGNLIVEKEVSIPKEVRHIEEDIRERKLEKLIHNSMHETFKLAMNRYDLNPWRTAEMDEVTKMAFDQRQAAFAMLSIGNLSRQTLQNTYEFVSPITNKPVKIQQGSKISKALKHFIPDAEQLNAAQVLYSQILNDKFLKGTLCLSIHPMDYLTASVNDSGWDSCYNTMDKGQYCASTLCLNNSPNTFIAYLKSSRDMEVGWSSDKITWNNKKWRTWVTLGKDNEVCHIGRNYPYESMALMNEVADMVKDLTQKSYNDLVINDGYVAIDAPDNMYNDADGSKWYVLMTDNYKYGVDIYEKECIHVSPKGSVCPMCGEHFDDIETDIVCSNCGDFERCYDCDCVTHDGDRVWVESISAYVCDCCSENYYYCDRCGEYHIEEDIVHVRGYYNNRWNEHSIDYTCRWCVDHANDIDTCPSCGEYVKADYAREDGTCQECPELPVEDEDEAV